MLSRRSSAVSRPVGLVCMGGNLVSTKSDVNPRRPRMHRSDPDRSGRPRAVLGDNGKRSRERSESVTSALGDRIIRARPAGSSLLLPPRRTWDLGSHPDMTVNQDILLPLLVAAIVINTVLMAGV